ncbi:RNA polymerase sigma factor [Aquamicrobium segne]|uniref:RNA polymerase sigma factor n=1 Tax=Aquamicrobium segne TaxID=469547 RepID=A0ABW0H1Y1_9HYPH
MSIKANHVVQSAPYQNEIELVLAAKARQPEAIRAIIKQYNQRLYRLARAIVRNDADAEEVLQEAYLQAFAAISSFRGEATLATWLSRITVNEALGWIRRKRRRVQPDIDLGHPKQPQIIRLSSANPSDDPERVMAQRQILGLVEQASDNLPEIYRVVFVARVIEGLNVEETAAALELKPATVKTRLNRARVLIRQDLEMQIGPLLLDAFPFAGARCERLTDAVMEKLDFL